MVHLVDSVRKLQILCFLGQVSAKLAGSQTTETHGETRTDRGPLPGGRKKGREIRRAAWVSPYKFSWNVLYIKSWHASSPQMNSFVVGSMVLHWSSGSSDGKELCNYGISWKHAHSFILHLGKSALREASEANTLSGSDEHVIQGEEGIISLSVGSFHWRSSAPVRLLSACRKWECLLSSASPLLQDALFQQTWPLISMDQTSLRLELCCTSEEVWESSRGQMNTNNKMQRTV